MTIWKYSLEATDRQNVMMPEGAQILTAQMQGETLCLWAIVNPEATKQLRYIEVIDTGHSIDDASRRYIATVRMEGGSLIFHVFERRMV